MTNHQTFESKLLLPVAARTAFAWHERPGTLERLIPPWEPVEIANRGDGIRNGSIVTLAQKLGPLKLKWVAKHFDCNTGRSFKDTQVSGPFSKWEHLHDFQPTGDNCCQLTDHIDYRLPGGVLGQLFGSSFVERKVDAMFAYRHSTTEADLLAHSRHEDKGTWHVAVTGARGLVGSTLVPLLTTGGHQVTKLVRRPPQEEEAFWNPKENVLDASSLDGIDAVVHLAGENIAARRWTPEVKAEIRDSRVHGTRLLCQAIAKMKHPPKVLVCASAIGFYGDRGQQDVDEETAAGTSFLADVAQQWEAATEPARAAGIRVVNLRFGIVLSPKDGALSKMLLPFKLGGGGRIGGGDQYWSWISIDDAAGVIHHALMTESLSGPVNAVTANPVTNLEFTKTLGRVLKRPTVVPLPAFAARLALGDMADELILASIRVQPKKLVESDYRFRQPTLEAALRHLLGR